MKAERPQTLPWDRQIEANLAKYCPHNPWPKQRFVLNLSAREIFFGGAKGPGKTDLILMSALRFVHVPGYAALFLRVSTKEAKQANSIMDRLMQWTAGKDARWNHTDASLRFPSGALFKFGYIDNPRDAYQFQGSEYQQIYWDELTQFRLSDDESNPYLFMFGMNRRPELGCHPDLTKVPLQVISASNPGSISHEWVRRRFVTDEAIAAIADPRPRAFYSDVDKKRCFVPAAITDNPAINAKEYIAESLNHLPPVLRERYVRGDWTIQENAIIPADWLCYFTMRGEILEARTHDGKLVTEIDCRKCTRFATIDTAGTSKQKAEAKSGKPASWSVCLIWDYWPQSRLLFLRHCWRRQVDYADLKSGIRDVLDQWKVPRAYAENAHFGPAIASEIPEVELVATKLATMEGRSGRGAKLERAAGSGFLTKLEKSEIYLPDASHVPGVMDWLPNLESEWLSWTGMEDETADQIDAASYACTVANDHVDGAVLQADFAFWKRS